MGFEINDWHCGGGLASKQIDKRSQQKIDFDADFKVFPNPSNGEFNIEFGNINNNSSIHIININGQVIKTITIDDKQKRVKCKWIVHPN